MDVAVIGALIPILGIAIGAIIPIMLLFGYILKVKIRIKQY